MGNVLSRLKTPKRPIPPQSIDETINVGIDTKHTNKRHSQIYIDTVNDELSSTSTTSCNFPELKLQLQDTCGTSG